MRTRGIAQAVALSVCANTVFLRPSSRRKRMPNRRAYKIIVKRTRNQPQAHQQVARARELLQKVRTDGPSP